MGRFRFVFFLFVLLGSNLASAETLKGALIDKAPFAWDENGQKQGFHYDVAQNIGKRTGYQLELQLAPVMRVIELLRRHSVDFIILTDFKELDEMKTQKALIIDVETSVYSLATSPIQNRDELKAAPIARLGKGCVALNDANDIRWLDVQSFDQAFDLLKAKRVKGVCSTLAFWHAVDKKGSRKEIHVFPINKRQVWVHTLSDLDDKKWKAIQKALKGLIKDKTIEKLSNHYVK